MSTKERTVKIFKDKKHKISYAYGQVNSNYQYICGPRTNNLWYRVIHDYGREVDALIPDGF